MRLAVRDIDRFAVTPADLSELDFEGAPGTVRVTRDHGCAREVSPTKGVTHDRPTGGVAPDQWFDLARELRPPCEAAVTWDGGTAHLSVVGYHYCALDEILDHGDKQRNSPRANGFGEQAAFRARAVAEAVADDICHRTFRATRRSEPAPALAGEPFQLSWPASRMLTPGFALAGDGLAVRVRPGARRACDRGLVEYVSGTDEGVPPDVRRAVAKLAASYLSVSNIPERATGESTDAGIIRYTLATEGTTGIPDVDAVLARHARSRLVVA